MAMSFKQNKPVTSIESSSLGIHPGKTGMDFNLLQSVYRAGNNENLNKRFGFD
jgi:hypothetical protein